MAAPNLNDRKLAAQVRSLALDKIKALLEMPEIKMKADDYELYKQVLIKLAGSVLPRLSELTGEDGKDLIIQVAKSIADKNDINPSPGQDSEQRSEVQSS